MAPTHEHTGLRCFLRNISRIYIMVPLNDRSQRISSVFPLVRKFQFTSKLFIILPTLEIKKTIHRYKIWLRYIISYYSSSLRGENRQNWQKLYIKYVRHRLSVIVSSFMFQWQSDFSNKAWWWSEYCRRLFKRLQHTEEPNHLKFHFNNSLKIIS